MPGTEEVDVTATARPRRAPAGLSPGESLIAEKLDDLVDEVRALREKAPSPKLLIAAGLALLTLQAAETVYLVGLIAESRGVDTSRAAQATTVVVGAAREAAPSEATEEPPGGPAGDEPVDAAPKPTGE